MANYSFNLVIARGSRQDLALVQAQNFAPLWGSSQDGHTSHWDKEDGQDILLYHGSSRRSPPCEDVGMLSQRYPACRFELSYIDEGLCYDGFSVYQDGCELGSGECSREEIEAAPSHEDSEVEPDDMGIARASHMRQMALLRGPSAPPEPPGVFDAYMSALAQDDVAADGLGAKAGLDKKSRALLAMLMDAPASLGARAASALKEKINDGSAHPLAVSMWSKKTPWGNVPGLRALVALHEKKAAGWMRGAWGAGDPQMLELAVCAREALAQGGWIVKERRYDETVVIERVEALFASKDVDGLLFSMSSDSLSQGNLSLGAGIVLAGLWDWGGPRPTQKLAAQTFEKLARASGRSVWLDQLFLTMAAFDLGAKNEFGLSSVRDMKIDAVLEASLPSLSEPTLEALLASALVGPAGRGAIESRLLQGATAQAQSVRRPAKL
jgi:hypothetical protein